MTEAEWLICEDSERMLKLLRGKSSDRKLRLFSVACCRHLLRQVQVSQKDVHAIDVAERYADGESTEIDLEAARTYVGGRPSACRTAGFACRDTTWTNKDAWVETDACACNAAWAAGEHAAFLVHADNASPAFTAGRAAEWAAQAALLRDVFGPVPFRPLPQLTASVVTWNDACVTRIAQAIYEERLFDRVPILADALEDAGCDNVDILNHCRSGGEHVRGCWVVDLLLGKE